MRLLFRCILCFAVITAGNLAVESRSTRSLAFRKGSSFFCLKLPHLAREAAMVVLYELLMDYCYRWAFNVLLGINPFATAGSGGKILSMQYRVNYKITMLPYTTVFAQAAGFKLVWELPSGSDATRTPRSVVDLHQAVELVYESHGFDGRSCLLKNVCQAMEYANRSNGVMAKILKLLTGSFAGNGTGVDPLSCDDHARNCPLELTGVDGFMGQ